MGQLPIVGDFKKKYTDTHTRTHIIRVVFLWFMPKNKTKQMKGQRLTTIFVWLG